MTPDWGKIASELVGTSGWYDHSYLKELDIDLFELEEKLTEHGVVRCDCCGWWVEIDECGESDAGDEVCDDCRKYG